MIISRTSVQEVRYCFGSDVIADDHSGPWRGIYGIAKTSRGLGTRSVACSTETLGDGIWGLIVNREAGGEYVL